jgi:alpha-beta hydrolase superfamily lysophospholipase
LFVLGASDDRISTPADVKATASLYGVTAVILPGLAHMLMLERDWESVARPLLAWLEGDSNHAARRV